MQSLLTRSLGSLLRVFDHFQTMERSTMMFSILEMEMILETQQSLFPETMASLSEISMLLSKRSWKSRKIHNLPILTLRSSLNKTQFQPQFQTFRSRSLFKLLHRFKCPASLQASTSLLTSTLKVKRLSSSARTDLWDLRLNNKNASSSE